jgi:hypothetical protein
MKVELAKADCLETKLTERLTYFLYMQSKIVHWLKVSDATFAPHTALESRSQKKTVDQVLF